MNSLPNAIADCVESMILGVVAGTISVNIERRGISRLYKYHF
jgi:hypothetical protein